jgi:hypothetical protein
VYEAIKERVYIFEDLGRGFSSEDLSQFTIEICGVLIPQFNHKTTFALTLMMTENTKTNLGNIKSTIVAVKLLLQICSRAFSASDG